MPYSRLIRNVLNTVPWWRDDLTVYVIAVPKRLKGDELEAALRAGVDEIVKQR